MKNFLIRVTYFFVFVSFFFAGNYCINYSFIKKKPLIESRNIMMGDSHIMTCFDPEIFDGWNNLANPSEPYYLTYLKLKYILDSGYAIDSIILGFSYHNISRFNDDKLRDNRAIELISNNYPLFISQELNDTIVDKQLVYKVLARKLFLFPEIDPFSRFGIWELHEKSLMKEDSVNRTLSRHYNNDLGKSIISETSKVYLNEIIELCQENEIPLYLLTTPLHHLYRRNIPVEIYKDFNSLKRKIQTQFGIKILDFSSLALDDNQFRDFDHLNKKGVEEFSEIVRIAM